MRSSGRARSVAAWTLLGAQDRAGRRRARGFDPAQPVHLAVARGGVPALSLPCGFDAHGLPLAVQLAGPRWSEPLLLRAGHTYQAVADWHLRRPDLSDRTALWERHDEGRQ
ncbi:MAG TPA: hypothetical protein VLD67_07770 [Vicinamibacterales bacterium]|nr:hypothetical protein [Vicinamibacterales bacterium]